MKIKDKVLIVEDEQSISNFISMILQASGFDTIVVRTGEEALTMVSSHCPDLIILDLGLPDMDGMEVLKSVRKWSNLPVVVVSARNHEHDKVEALDYGADDYLVKPFGTSELLARIRTAIRHTRTALPNGEIAQSGKFTTGELTIDYDKHQVLLRGENAKLTVNEYKIVALLGKYAGKGDKRKVYSLIAAVFVGLGCILICVDSLGGAGISPFNILGIEKDVNGNLPTWCDCWLDFFDCISEGILMPLGALLMCLCIGWELGPKMVDDECCLEGQSFKMKGFFNICVKFITPLCMLLVPYGQIREFFF